VKHLNRVKKYGTRVAFVASAGLLPVASFAAAGPYDAITDAVDFARVATAVGVIAGLIAVALVAKKGARMVLSMIGR
jgi:hypothetical protein